MTSKLRLIGIAIGFFLIGFTAFDLYGPREVDLRQFDPAAVGRLEVEAWKAYYAGNQSQLFGAFGELLRTQFGYPRLRAFVNAYRLAKGALVFKEASDAITALKALPYLRRFFDGLCQMNKKHCHPEQCAQRELSSWTLHRERNGKELVTALAGVAAEIYSLPVAKFLPYAEKRVQALSLRDANEGSPDWAKIEAELVVAYRLLYSAANQD